MVSNTSTQHMKPTTYPILLVTMLQHKHQEGNKELLVVFVHLNKSLEGKCGDGFCLRKMVLRRACVRTWVCVLSWYFKTKIVTGFIRSVTHTGTRMEYRQVKRFFALTSILLRGRMS